MSGSSPPPAPNYSPIAEASERAAKEYAQIMREQLDWAKQQYGDNKAFTDTMKTVLAQTATDAAANARKDRARYEELYQPLENDLINDAETFGSEENKERYRSRATAGVAEQFDTAGDAAKRQLESYGIDPGATRYAALDVGVRTAKAAAQAAAANNSDLAVEDRARGMRTEAINIGKGYPGQVAGSYGTSTGSGTGAVGAQNSTYAASAPALANPTAWAGLGTQALGQWGNTLNNQYQNQLEGYKASQNSSSGIGSMLGGIASIGSMFLSDVDDKTDIEPVGRDPETGEDLYAFRYKTDPKSYPKVVGPLAQDIERSNPGATRKIGGHRVVDGPYNFAEGGVVPALPPNTPSPQQLDVAGQQGGTVPRSMSPSGGRVTDDVQATVNGVLPARIDSGEFIFPKRTTQYYGTKTLHQMIQKADAAMSGVLPSGGAKSQSGDQQSVLPTNSRPQQGASQAVPA